MPQSGSFIIQLPRRVLRVYWLGYLQGSVFRERVSGASSLACAGLKQTAIQMVKSSHSQIEVKIKFIRIIYSTDHINARILNEF